jgi:hypothetical protein
MTEIQNMITVRMIIPGRTIPRDDRENRTGVNV